MAKHVLEALTSQNTSEKALIVYSSQQLHEIEGGKGPYSQPKSIKSMPEVMRMKKMRVFPLKFPSVPMGPMVDEVSMCFGLVSPYQ